VTYQDAPGPLTIIAQVFVGLHQMSKAKKAEAEARQAEDRARRQMQKAEREAEARLKEWREIVEQQKSRGRAGFAGEAEAVAALRGRGGRASPLDGRKFR
jgi:hypothetical protein